MSSATLPEDLWASQLSVCLAVDCMLKASPDIDADSLRMCHPKISYPG